MDDKTYEQIIQNLGSIDASDGLDMSEILSITDDLRQLLTWMIRKNRFDSKEVMAHFSLKKHQVRQLIFTLKTKGFIEETKSDNPRQEEFHVNVKQGRNYRVPTGIWKVFDE